ncbi:hypothetical protein ASPCADRAFT_212468 [Aspergillus carbonarius ITEM 5010]|uniref:Uncharacterized protein n=1 Tax=Aspergillus carbonarius (strain ITEM 5010) TaxID=602072 RepID=A0A1R3R5P2_ASPC5|nr:hypothetical protein ASPCADRAFT_212468 [Aspergillus carbonarius ITEM 5010]
MYVRFFVRESDDDDDDGDDSSSSNLCKRGVGSGDAVSNYNNQKTHAKAVFPAPGGPNTSVTCPNGNPFVSPSSKSDTASGEHKEMASSSADRPVGRAFLPEAGNAVDACRDCDAGKEITRSG